MKNSRKKQLGKLGVLAFGSAMLVACNGSNSGDSKYVECYGVASKPVVMTSAICKKLASTKAVPTEAPKNIVLIKARDYIKCYGVAAAGKNDCATKTTSCAGSAKKAKQPDAWVSLPSKDICKLLGGTLTIG